MKVVTVVGARPQFVKCAPVSRELRKVATEVLVHTGQHYDENMSEVFFRELQIPEPDYNLDVGSGSHGEQTAEMLKRAEEVLLRERPDIALVYGDTNSTLAGALAAAKLHIRVAHVEAGLRSFNKLMPEEINRRLTDHVADFLFCPTKTAVTNLRAEGITERVYLVGDVMYDSILHNAGLAESKLAVVERLGLTSKKYALATVHRAENTDDPARLAGILQALDEIACEFPVILPLHPRTRRHMETLGVATANVRILGPVSYLEMLCLEKHARMIFTDSGGVQKEAYSLQIPCVTLRDETEWGETVESGWNVLAGTDPGRILRAARNASRPRVHPDLFGEGCASQLIVAVLRQS